MDIYEIEKIQLLNGNWMNVLEVVEETDSFYLLRGSISSCAATETIQVFKSSILYNKMKLAQT